MRSPILAAALLVGGALSLAGQTSNVSVPITAPAAKQDKMIAFLPKPEQDRVMSAHSKALADNPALKAEETSLQENKPDRQTATPEDIMAYVERAQAYQQKLREAMLKEDPGLGPILDKIDKHLSEMRAKRALAAAAAGGTGTNGAPAPTGTAAQTK